MGSLAYQGIMSKGQDGGPPTPLTHKLQCTKTFLSGGVVGVVGDQFEAHTVGRTVHQDGLREIVSGSTKTFFEGFAAARTGDPISDGDAVGEGDAKTKVG